MFCTTGAGYLAFALYMSTMEVYGKKYAGRSMVHNPIWDGSNGILEEMPENMEGLITCDLDFEKREQAVKNYPLRRYLNKELYRREMGF